MRVRCVVIIVTGEASAFAVRGGQPRNVHGTRRERATMIAFRGDVEGLRAVAVLLVVLDHLEVPGFRGGFMGVDVFFVISGYLITSLLAAECAKKAEARGGRGSISIPGFYARRARRILPAALTVIVAVVVAGGVLLNELRVAQIRHDAAVGRPLRVERELHPAGDRLLRAGPGR